MRNCSIEDGVNDRNLEIVSELLINLDYIIFYGTLLGVTRAGATIPGDDDIDIIMKIEARDEVLRLLKNAGHAVELNEWPNNKSNSFLQCSFENEFGAGYVDFYFIAEKENYFVDSWSFWGMDKNPLCYIKIDKDWLYEIDLLPFRNSKLKVPKARKRVLEFLYGTSWSQPVKKGDSYLTIPFRGKPYQVFGRYKILALVYMKIIRTFFGLFS